ncbi:uncharacterized protein LOC143009944 [Genypterus blacodes]|uniref:uncharacterized protein LOC143009944 n=1 Tax=Genypterus blacodes TaxID=154954 RepID=UPI003F75E411
MASLSWLMVASSLLLIAGNCVGAVDQNRLAQVVKVLTEQYDVGEGIQFSLAANIPLSQFTDPTFDRSNLINLIKPDTNAIEDIKKRKVYIGTRVVVSLPKNSRHAELNVLRAIPTNWVPSGNFLLIYSFNSPCGTKCTNPEFDNNILVLNKEYVLRWGDNHAFVFTKIFDKPTWGNIIIDKDVLRAALTNLANANLGMNNIFHCYTPGNEFLCSTCSSGGRIAEHCIDNNVGPQQGGSTGQSSSRSRSPSIEQHSSSSRGKGGSNERRARSKERREGPRERRDPSPERRDQNREHRARSKERRDGPRKRRDPSPERRDQSREHRARSKERREGPRERRDPSPEHRDQNREHRARSKERRDGPRKRRDPSPERRDQNREHRARSKERRDGPRERRGERKVRRNQGGSQSRSQKSNYRRRSNSG